MQKEKEKEVGTAHARPTSSAVWAAAIFTLSPPPPPASLLLPPSSFLFPVSRDRSTQLSASGCSGRTRHPRGWASRNVVPAWQTEANATNRETGRQPRDIARQGERAGAAVTLLCPPGRSCGLWAQRGARGRRRPHKGGRGGAGESRVVNVTRHREGAASWEGTLARCAQVGDVVMRGAGRGGGNGGGRASGEQRLGSRQRAHSQAAMVTAA